MTRHNRTNVESDCIAEQYDSVFAVPYLDPTNAFQQLALSVVSHFAYLVASQIHHTYQRQKEKVLYYYKGHLENQMWIF
jgi:hypothetical protein